MPLLHTSARSALPRPHVRSFAEALSEADVCLQCASPLNTQCGFGNCSLTQDAASGRWHWELFSCECESCEHACGDTGGGGDPDADAEVRARLLERHRFSKLDAALGVDEPTSRLATYEANAVPVLCVRRAVLELQSGPRSGPLARLVRSDSFVPHDAIESIFCSFERTALFVGGTRRGAVLFEQRVVARAAVLASRHQISLPQLVLDEPRSCVYARAMLLRVVVAYDAMHALRTDVALRSPECEDDRRLLALALQLFADTHLDLHVYCDVTGNWRDAYLERPLANLMVPTEWGAAMLAADAPPDARRSARRTLIADCAALSPLERCYPHPLRAVYGGELLDLGGLLAHSNIWSRVDYDTKTSATSFAHMFLRKAVDHKCMVRGFHSMMSAEIGRQPVLVALLMNLLEVSSLGNYESARQAPRWRARLAVRRSHHWDRFEPKTWCAACHKGTRAACPLPGCDDRVPLAKSSVHAKHLCDLCAYLHRNHRLLFFAVKEFYVYSIRSHGAIDTLLELDSSWSDHYKMLLAALDDARLELSRPFDIEAGAAPRLAATDIMRAQAAASHQLMLMHDCSKPTFRRLHKAFTFAELLLPMLRTLHEERVVCTRWTGFQQPQDFLAAPLLDPRYDEEAPPRDRFELFYVTDAPLEHLAGRRWCDVYRLEQVRALARYCARVHGDVMLPLLAGVGMSPAAHRRLLHMQHASELRDMPDNKLGDLCEQLCDEHRVDFHLLHFFLEEMDSALAVRPLPLDAAQTVAQARALRLRTRTEPWEALPVGCDTIQLCRAHRCVFAKCSPVFNYEQERKEVLARDGSLAQLDSTATVHGTSGVRYDHDLGGLVCSVGIKSASQQNWSKLGLKRALWIDDNESRVSSILAVRESERACANRLLEQRSVLGVAWRVGKQTYTLCVKCGALCEWRDACMTTHGMTCGRELRLVERERYTELAHFGAVQAAPLRAHRAPHSESVADQLVPISEVYLLPPPPLDERGDLLERTSTPLFDRDREEDVLAAANASLRRGYDGQQSEATQTGGGGGTGTTSSGARAAALFGVGVDHSAADENAAEAALRAKRARDTQRRKQPGVRKRRTNVTRIRYADRHKQQPPGYRADEWASLTDEAKMYRWTPEGRVFWRNYCTLRKSSVPDAPALLRMLTRRESERISRLRRERFYERELERARNADECAESLYRARRRVCVDRLTDHEVVALRELFIDVGLLERHVEIACAYCRARCERSSRFRRLTVRNVHDTLVDGHLGEPLGERGLVHVFLCIKCFDACKKLLAQKPLPLVSDVFVYMNDRRQRATERTIRFLQRR